MTGRSGDEDRSVIGHATSLRSPNSSIHVRAARLGVPVLPQWACHVQRRFGQSHFPDADSSRVLFSSPLRKLNEVMAGDYELRVFRHTYGDDTHCFYLAACDWWAAMEGAFPSEIRRVFVRITPRMDFPDYRE
jgi:hypothetical protein